MRRSSAAGLAPALTIAPVAIVGTVGGELRKPWLLLFAWGASGIAHAAVLAVACCWSASEAQVHAPAQGASAISLRAAPTIVVEPIIVSERQPQQLVQAVVATQSIASSEALQARTIAVARRGKMPPAVGEGEQLAASQGPPNIIVPKPQIAARTEKSDLPAARAAPTPQTAPQRSKHIDPPSPPASVAAVAPDVSVTMVAAGAESPPRPIASANPSPVYPPQAYLQRLEGTVVVRASISRQGTVSDARLRTSSGFALLDREALRAVRLWRFEPARRGGIAVSQTVDLPIRFYLED